MRHEMLWALGASLGAAATAGAAFLGVVRESYVGPGWATNGFSGLTAWRFYAEFSSPTDGLTAVSGISSSPLHVFSGNGWFFNSALADDLTAPMPLIPLIWSNQWDTYVTIGTDTAIGDETLLSPYFGPLVGWLTGDFWADNAAWMVPSHDPQGLAGPDGRVFFAQFVVEEGDWVNGRSRFWFFDGTQALNVQWAPAPAAPGLLVVAALIGVRRRRPTA